MFISSRRVSYLSVSLTVGAVCVLATSCGSLAHPDPDRALFSIEPGKPSPAPAHAAPVLRVSRLRIDAPYNGSAFVYLNKDGRLRSDYYNAFAAPPDQLLTQYIIRWLSAAGSFEAVVDTASEIPSQYVMEGTVTALNGDYTDPSAAKAVMAIRVFVLDTTGEHGRIILRKEYRSSVLIEKGSVNSLVAGWRVALRDILNEMTMDLGFTRISQSQG